MEKQNAGCSADNSLPWLGEFLADFKLGREVIDLCLVLFLDSGLLCS